MDPHEKRRHPRVRTNNLFAHTTMDKQGRYLAQGMGKALDISQTGLKLETSYPIEGEKVSLMSADMNDRLIEIIGKPLYCNPAGPDTYHTGIEFIGSQEEIQKFAAELVRLQQHRRHETFVRVAA